MAEKIEQFIPWMTIFIIILMITFGIGIVLKEVIADSIVPSVTVGNVVPTVGTVILNGGSDIVLTENTTATIQATTTVTDDNGYDHISSVIGKIYRSEEGSGCSADDNNCYSDSTCVTSSCSGASCVVTCEYAVWFHGDPTDAGSFWESEDWEAWIKAIDGSNASSSATSTGVETNTLRALGLSTSSISYGSLNPGDDTGTLSETTTVTDTGNSAIDIYLYGTNMESGANSIPVGNQEWSASTSLNYDSGTDLTSATDTQAELDLSKPTSNPSTSTDDLYWGFGAPSGVVAGSYTGTTTFEAKIENWWYVPSGSWAKEADTIVRDISNLSNSDATVSKDIYCDNSNCVLWTDGAATPTSFCIATGPNVYGNILWEKTDTSSGITWADSYFYISGGDIGGTHDASLECGDNNYAIGAKNWLVRNYTSSAGTFNAMDACKAKGSGWRLPNFLELDGIRDQVKGSSPYSRLPNITSGHYWSSSESNNMNAWLLKLSDGWAVGYFNKTNPYYLRCVRGQES